MGKVWIVLINKSPRGPLTLEEVESLLSEKILKRSDLALKLNPELPDERTHWKFLWQFEEFDRRLNKDSKAEITQRLSDKPEERRAHLSENEIKTQLSDQLPDEFAGINPEDLVVKSQKIKDRGLGALFVSDGEKDIETLPYENQSPKSLLPKVAVVALVLVSLFAYFKPKGSSVLVSKELKPVLNATRNPAETLTPPLRQKPSQPIELQKSVSLEKVLQEPPQLPKQNEISLEDYRRLKEERQEKEREEEQDREQIKEAERRLSEEDDDPQEIAENEGEDQDASLQLPLKKSKKAKAKKRAKRRIQAEEESDLDSQQREDSQSENQIENQEEDQD